MFIAQDWNVLSKCCYTWPNYVGGDGNNPKKQD